MGLSEEVRNCIFARLRAEGFQVAERPVNDDGAHAEVRWNNRQHLRIRVQARKKSEAGNYANFKNIRLPERWENFFFLFCSKELGKMWLMSAQEFANELGERKGVNFCGQQQDISGKYEVQNFKRLKEA